MAAVEAGIESTSSPDLPQSSSPELISKSGSPEELSRPVSVDVVTLKPVVTDDGLERIGDVLIRPPPKYGEHEGFGEKFGLLIFALSR